MDKPVKTIYVPDSIPSDFTYLIPNTDYYDLYNTKYIQPGQTVKFYRFYYDLDEDMYQNFSQKNNETTQKSVGSEIRVNLSNDYIYRRDYPDILLCSTIIILGLVVLFNLVTSIIKKGGLLSGLL